MVFSFLKSEVAANAFYPLFDFKLVRLVPFITYDLNKTFLPVVSGYDHFQSHPIQTLFRHHFCFPRLVKQHHYEITHFHYPI